MRNKTPEEAHFIAHYLAKYPNSYDSLKLGNQTQTHNTIGETLKISPSSFKRLRDEYDGFYNNRKGYQNPEKRPSRVKYKNLFSKIEHDEYLKQINSILINPIELDFDQITSDEVLLEGNIVSIKIDKHERNAKAKRKCLEHYKKECVICGFKDKSSQYTNIDIIEVHHLKPISEKSEEHIVDPIQDLRPVCPNCHRALHSKKDAYSIEELKAIINSSK